MIGFSAGGMVTSEALFGPAETRPDFAAIIYGAREIKEMPDPAPPLFLAVAADDAMAVGRTVDLFTAYRKGKGPAELHVFQMGAHGFVNKGGGADHFMDRLEEWLGPTSCWRSRRRLPPPGACRGRKRGCKGHRRHLEADLRPGERQSRGHNSGEGQHPPSVPGPPGVGGPGSHPRSVPSAVAIGIPPSSFGDRRERGDVHLFCPDGGAASAYSPARRAASHSP